jgi:hypothetical protein
MMADEVSRAVEVDELRGNDPIGVSECLVNIDREMQDWGFGHVDNSQAISQNLVRQILPKCRPLELSFYLPADWGWSKSGYAHGGFIRGEAIQSRPGGTTTTKYSVFPITAKRNLRRVWNLRGKEYRPVTANLKVKGGHVAINSPDLDWVPSETDHLDPRRGSEARPSISPWGYDVSVGHLLTNPENSATSAQLSFTMARKNVELRKGQKVGIAVMFNEDSKSTKKTIAGAFEGIYFKLEISVADIERIYGKPEKVNIYTGEIKLVGEMHIEYDINSFTGCSGAVVFLLDENQPEDSVQQCDWGAAVAIHAGAHPSQGDRNYGFMIKHYASLWG